MKNVAKNAFYIAMTSAILGVNSALAAINPIVAQPDQNLVTPGELENVVQGWIVNLLGFLGVLALIYALYGGFLITTAAGDDEKVTNGKKVIMQALIGIVVLFAANLIIDFVFRILA